MKETVLLIDNENLVHRAYFATFKKETKPNGLPIAAINTWASMVQTLMREFRPAKVIFALDNPSVFRRTLFPEYKAHRKPKPEDLKLQLLLIKRLTRRIGLPYIEDHAHEADDLIGSLVQTLAPTYTCLVASTDKDFGQLINDDVVQVKPDSDKIWTVLNADTVYENLGVHPDQVALYLALTGDDVDNIPGIDGVGPKTALRILQERPSFEETIKKVCTLRDLPENVVRGALVMNHHLTTIRRDIAVTVQKREPDPTVAEELQKIGAFHALKILTRIMREEKFKANPLPDEPI